MDAYSKIDECNDNIAWEELFSLDCSFESYEDLQNKYAKLHETYLREIENIKRVKKNLEKSLKYYSKLCKKFEAQKKIISSLEKNIQEKMNCLEESYKNQEKLKGLIDIYKSERSLYTDESIYDLKKDKELLLDICCQLINESVKTNNIRNIANIILRKFKKDLNNEKLSLLKGRQGAVKKEINKFNECSSFSNIKSFKLLTDSLSNKISETSKQSIEVKKETSLNLCVPAFNEHLKNDQNKRELLDNSVQMSLELNESAKKYDANTSLTRKNEINLNTNNLMTVSNFQPDRVKNGKVEMEGFISEKSFCLPVLKPCNQTISESKEERTSFTELELFKEFDKSYDLLDSSDSIIIKNNNSGNSSFLPKSSVCSEMSNLNLTKNACCKKTESNEVLPENFNSLQSQKTCIASDLPSSVVSPIENKVKKKADKKNAALLEFGDSDSQKNVVELKVLRKVCNDGLNCDLKTICPDPTQKSSVVENQKFNFIEPSNEPSTVKSISIESRSSPIVLETQEVCRSVFDVPEDATKITKEDKVQNECCLELELAFEKTSQNTTVKTSVLSDRELDIIFSEMTDCVRCLSPIKESNKTKSVFQKNNANHFTLCDGQATLLTKSSDSLCSFLPKTRQISFTEKEKLNQKNDGVLGMNKSKKIKLDETEQKNLVKERKENYLDSILSAMSIQNEKLKANEFQRGDVLLDKFENHNSPKMNQNQLSSEENIEIMNLKNEVEFNHHIKEKKDLCDNYQNNSQPLSCENKNLDKQLTVEKILIKKLHTFVTSTFSNEEETDKSVKECILVLTNCTDDAIARIIVNIVFENVNEEIEPRERPVPPLTKTQNHLIILLSVFKTQDIRCDNIISLILLKICEKLFPDIFFWPDDSVETASRFFIALCKHRNDVKTFWEFCFRAMMDMKQRSCLVLLVALKTWPDTLFNATSEKNNILVVTAINIILHMPKGNRNQRQNTILLALKRLLQDFYGFRVNETIENIAAKLLDSFFGDEIGAEKSLVLLSKCRDVAWTSKNVLSKLISFLMDLMTSEDKDNKGPRVLRVLKQILPYLSMNGNKPSAKITKIISTFSEILNSGKLEHEVEQEIVEILLGLKQYSPAKKIVREWKPKKPIDDDLRREINIIITATDNILREMKFNQEKKDYSIRCQRFNKKRGKKSKKKLKSRN